MLISNSKNIYDEFKIRPNNLLKPARKIIPEPVNYVKSSDNDRYTRYNKCRKLISHNKTYYETYKRYGIIESTGDEYYTVDKSTVNRLDIISDKFYNNASYWWVIALANNIIDPFSIQINTVLRIPAIMSLYLEGGILS